MAINNKRKIGITFIIIIIITAFLNSIAYAESNIEKPSIQSESAILIEEKTGRTLYEKNPDQLMNPASLTKIATAIYAIEEGNLEDIVTVSKNAREVEGTRVYLDEGEKVPLKKLIQGLLINSGNDAAIAIAEHLDGTVDKFAVNLNQYLKEIGLQNTNFVNPHGLYQVEHKTTARDLAKITQHAMKNEIFREMFGAIELKWDGESWDTTLYTHHKLMREIPYQGITGGKTGYVDESGITLITTATRGDLSVIVVTLNAQNDDVAYQDTVNLLDYAFSNFKIMNIEKGTSYEINNAEYKTDETLKFTVSNNETIKYNVSNEGILEIKNENQEVIASFQLINDKESKGNVNAVKTKDSEIESVDSKNFINLILVVFLFISLFFYFFKTRIVNSK